MFQFAKNSAFVAATSMVGTASAFNGYTGSFSLKPEEDCQGICMCMGDQDMSGLVDGGNDATGKTFSAWYKCFLFLDVSDSKMSSLVTLVAINLCLTIILVVLFAFFVLRFFGYLDAADADKAPDAAAKPTGTKPATSENNGDATELLESA